MKLIFILFTLIITDFIWIDTALAWGPAVHMFTALSALDNAAFILPSIAGIVTSFPLEYLYGCLAADFFIGKGRRRSGNHLHNWEGGFRFLDEATGDREAAYAYGFLSHLAADVIAHNFFIPNIIRGYPAGNRVGHVFCEAKADYLVGHNYMRIARDVLGMDHHRCDKLLRLMGGKGNNGLMAKKRIFAQSVRASNYIYMAHNTFFAGKIIHGRVFEAHLFYMLDLSCRLVRDLLSNPESSLCLSYDPLGRESLRLAKRKGPLTKRHGPGPEHHGYTSVDMQILEL